MTQKSRIESCRRLIDRQPMGVPFPLDVLNEFASILRWPIFGAKRMPNPTYARDTRHIHELLIDGSWKAISWRDIISPPNPWTEILRCLRYEIQDDLADYRSAALLQECAYCGCPEDLTVDHMSKPFDQIAKEWVALNGEPAMTDGPAGVGNIIADRDVAASWITYHAGHAVYQLLCRSHNSSKGKRERPRSVAAGPIERV